MNHIYHPLWNDSVKAVVAVSENTHGTGRKPSLGKRAGNARFAVHALSAALMLAFGMSAQALPQAGVVAAGSASIASGAASTTITQTTANAVINWQSFSIGSGQAVQFIQPGASSVALNRVLGADPSSILGSLSANGKVFLLNPNGVMFGSGASVNFGGLVASTLGMSDANFMAGKYNLTDPGSGRVLNQGTITAADGGYVALLGKTVSNQGVISARMGTVVLASGSAMTLDLSGDGLLNVSVTQGAVNALVDNGGMIRAAGGNVLLTAQGAGQLLHTAVNNTGVIEAQTLSSRNGQIMLLADMQSGTVSVGGTLDASAPNGGNGGFIETSAAHVNVLDNARVTTAAPMGLTGTWLIDPQDFIIGVGGNIAGATLSALLVTNSVTISTSTGPDATVAGTPPVTSLNTAVTGNGDIFVNDAISWTATPSPTTLRLSSTRDVNVNAAVSATNGNFVVCCGRDINVNAAITTVNGSVLLTAGRNVNQSAAVTTTDGNIMMCAANDVTINAKITLTRSTLDPIRSLGLPAGLTLNADTDGTGPGAAGGTVKIQTSGPDRPTVTDSFVRINYNPVSYSTPTDYLPQLILTNSTLTPNMLVFPEVTKAFDGNTTVVFTGLKGSPTGVSLIADPGSTAVFDTFDAGVGKTVTFTGYRLGGSNANQFALPVSCCGPTVGQTRGTILPPLVPVPVPVPVVVPVEVPVVIPGVVPDVIPDVIPDVGPDVIADVTGDVTAEIPHVGVPTAALTGILLYPRNLLPASPPVSEGTLYLPVVNVVPRTAPVVTRPAPVAERPAPPVVRPPEKYIAPVYAPKPQRN